MKREIITLWVDSDIKRMAKAKSEKENRSLSNYLETLLKNDLKAKARKRK